MRVRNSPERYAVENAYFSPSILTNQDKNNGKFISINRQIILRNLFLAAAHTREAIANYCWFHGSSNSVKFSVVA